MKLTTLGEGFIHRCPEGDPQRVACTARCAVTADGEVVCSYMLQSALGINDFVPALSRSTDGGRTWRPQGPIWPALRSRYSITVSISRSRSGELLLFGSRTPIEQPGESFWCEQTLGIKQNELVWARSTDGGRTWTEPHPFPIPLPGAAETPAPICVTRAGRWLAPYAPHPTFDPDLEVDRNHIVLMLSEDRGRTWRHTSMLRFDAEGSAPAEAWAIELADGRVLGTCWHARLGPDPDYPNAYGLSLDGGLTWQPTRATTIHGQSTGLAALPDGRALLVYNQRLHDTPGVWLAVARPTPSDFGLLANQIVWRCEQATMGRSSGQHEQWTDFAFGEPSVTVLADGTLLVALWCIQPSGSGIRCVRLRPDEIAR